MIREFKKFITRKNVIDLAVAVIMGAAATSIVQSFVRDIFSPILGIFLGGVDFSSLSINFGNASIRYGSFIQAIINFLIIAFVVFLIIQAIQELQRRFLHIDEEILGQSELKVLQEIRDILKNKQN
jgi:large conductance mechanosensitive channel